MVEWLTAEAQGNGANVRKSLGPNAVVARNGEPTQRFSALQQQLSRFCLVILAFFMTMIIFIVLKVIVFIVLKIDSKNYMKHMNNLNGKI